jgi:hypothetical protein
MGIGSIVIGLIIMIVLWIGAKAFGWMPYKDFFSLKPETAPEGLIDRPVEHAPAEFFPKHKDS